MTNDTNKITKTRFKKKVDILRTMGIIEERKLHPQVTQYKKN